MDVKIVLGILFFIYFNFLYFYAFQLCFIASKRNKLIDLIYTIFIVIYILLIVKLLDENVLFIFYFSIIINGSIVVFYSMSMWKLKPPIDNPFVTEEKRRMLVKFFKIYILFAFIFIYIIQFSLFIDMIKGL